MSERAAGLRAAATVVVLEVGPGGFGGAVGEEAEEETGAVRVLAAGREVDARTGAPGRVAGLPPQAGGDPKGADVLIAEGGFVQERAQCGGHFVDDSGPDLLVVRPVGAHRRLVVEAVYEYTGRGEEDGEVVPRTVLHQGCLFAGTPGAVKGVVAVLRIVGDRCLQDSQRTQVGAEFDGGGKAGGGLVHSAHGVMEAVDTDNPARRSPRWHWPTARVLAQEQVSYTVERCPVYAPPRHQFAVVDPADDTVVTHL